MLSRCWNRGWHRSRISVKERKGRVSVPNEWVSGWEKHQTKRNATSHGKELLTVNQVNLISSSLLSNSWDSTISEKCTDLLLLMPAVGNSAVSIKFSSSASIESPKPSMSMWRLFLFCWRIVMVAYDLGLVGLIWLLAFGCARVKMQSEKISTITDRRSTTPAK